MKRNKIYTSFFLLTILISWSCNEDFLYRPPKDTLLVGNFYTTAEGIQMAVNAMYQPLGAEGFNGKTYWMIGDGASDDAGPNGDDPDYIPIDQFTLAADNARNAGLWQEIYTMIALTNIVLENIEGNSADQSILDAAEGQARALRAFGYFILVQLYSDVPLLLDGMTPIELEAPYRTSAYEVYLQIIEDLKRASDILPTRSEFQAINPDFVGRINKHAAMGLLAYVYMTIAGELDMYNTETYPDNETNIAGIMDETSCWNTALDLCDDIINSNEYSLIPNFRDLWTREGDNCAESIWQLQFLGCGGYEAGNMRQAFWAPWQSDITGNDDGWGTHSPSAALAACFYDDPDSLIISGNTVDASVVPPGDKRFYWTLLFPGVPHEELPQSDGTPYTLAYSYGASGFACKKYVIGSGPDVCSMQAPNNVYMLRLGEILIMKAECLAELGQTAEAASTLDPIRERAGKPGISTSLSQTEMIDAVRLERRRELALEQKRWFDILRWGIAEDVLAEQGINMPLARRLFPIPNTEIALNKNLKQNTSY